MVCDRKWRRCGGEGEWWPSRAVAARSGRFAARVYNNKNVSVYSFMHTNTVTYDVKCAATAWRCHRLYSAPAHRHYRLHTASWCTYIHSFTELRSLQNNKSQFLPLRLHSVF